MSIHQLQVSFDAIQDRLVLRVSTTASEEIRAHLTRRFVREIWPHLTRVLSGHLGGTAPRGEGPAADQTRKSDGTFSEPFKDDKLTRPLGSTPLLVAECQIEAPAAGRCRLTLREPRERSLVLELDRSLMEIFCSMLRAAATAADWGLSLEYDAQPATPAPEPDDTLPKVLH